MPTIPKLSFTTYLYITFGVVILGLCLYCNVLSEENDRLVIKNSELSLSYKSKVNALILCSDGVSNLKKREEELNANHAKALAEAKKKAASEYKAANEILFSKPKTPTITPDNAYQFGGQDIEVKLKDYHATHLLINEYLTTQKEKK